MKDAGLEPNETTPAALPLGKVAGDWIELGTSAVARGSGPPAFEYASDDANTRHQYEGADRQE